LRSETLVCNEPRRERPNEHPGQEIADKRLQLQSVRKGAKDERKADASDDGCDKRCLVRHSLVVSSAGRKSTIEIISGHPIAVLLSTEIRQQENWKHTEQEVWP
jgi:hypothetical protein